MYQKLEPVKKKLLALGYNIQDPWDIVEAFESMVADYAGSKYAVAVDSCTNSLFLCMKYLEATGEVEVPKRTYLSVPQTVIHAGCTPKFVDLEWKGLYQMTLILFLILLLDLQRGCTYKTPINVYRFILEKYFQSLRGV